MRALVPIAGLVALSFPAAAGDRDFNAVVRSVERNLHVHRTHIPLFGLAKFLVRVSHPAGARQLDMAIFEDVRLEEHSIQRLDTAIRSAIDGHWTPMIRARERGEWTVIYARPDGAKHLRMLIASVDSHDAVVVQLEVNAEQVFSDLGANPHCAKRYVHGANYSTSRSRSPHRPPA